MYSGLENGLYNPSARRNTIETTAIVMTDSQSPFASAHTIGVSPAAVGSRRPLILKQRRIRFAAGIPLVL